MQTNDSQTPRKHFLPTPPPELSAKETSSPIHMASIPGTASQKHIWVITGPAGCGKTSVASFLQASHSMPYLEGDMYHTPDAVKKMADGLPLTDADRWDWLILLRQEALKSLQKAEGVIVTCSALKRKYRDVLRIAHYHDPNVHVHFIFLCASEALLIDRVRARKGHYMKDTMVHSQFESLEAPQADEFDVLSIDASGTSEEVRDLARNVVNRTLGEKA